MGIRDARRHARQPISGATTSARKRQLHGLRQPSGTDASKPSPVGSFKPNAFGLYDMAGNVWQWVQDCCHDNYNGAPTDGSAWIEGGDCNNHIDRGGSWNFSPDSVRSAPRDLSGTGQRIDNLGFRVGRTLIAP